MSLELARLRAYLLVIRNELPPELSGPLDNADRPRGLLLSGNKTMAINSVAASSHRLAISERDTTMAPDHLGQEKPYAISQTAPDPIFDASPEMVIELLSRKPRTYASLICHGNTCSAEERGQSSMKCTTHVSGIRAVWSLGVILVNLNCSQNPWKRASVDTYMVWKTLVIGSRLSSALFLSWGHDDGRRNTRRPGAEREIITVRRRRAVRSVRNLNAMDRIILILENRIRHSAPSGVSYIAPGQTTTRSGNNSSKDLRAYAGSQPDRHLQKRSTLPGLLRSYYGPFDVFSLGCVLSDLMAWVGHGANVLALRSISLATVRPKISRALQSLSSTATLPALLLSPLLFASPAAASPHGDVQTSEPIPGLQIVRNTHRELLSVKSPQHPRPRPP